MEEQITRTEIPGTGCYRYESNVRGVVYRSSKVLYTHAALFSVDDGRPGPLTFHKSFQAAHKTKGATGPSGPYWTKVGVIEIEALDANASQEDAKMPNDHDAAGMARHLADIAQAQHDADAIGDQDAYLATDDGMSAETFAENQRNAELIAELTGDAVSGNEGAAVVEWCREWASDCSWLELDAEEVANVAAPMLLKSCHRHIDGGLGFVLADIRRHVAGVAALELANDARQGIDRNCPACATQTESGPWPDHSPGCPDSPEAASEAAGDTETASQESKQVQALRSGADALRRRASSAQLIGHPDVQRQTYADATELERMADKLASLTMPAGGCQDEDDLTMDACPACGNPINYCQGHGEIGDPLGAAVLARHDAGNHDTCHPGGCDDAGSETTLEDTEPESETYNGWKNYPTWAVALWLDNDEGLYEESRSLTRVHLSTAPDDDNVARGVWTIEEAARFRLADAIKAWVRDDLAPDLEASFASDLLGWALDHVDWEEIAAARIGDEEPDDYGAARIRTGYPAPIAYTYEASEHCPVCAARRFGVDEHGTIPEDARDDEGNPVGAVAPWDAFEDRTMSCGTCGEVIHEVAEPDDEERHDGYVDAARALGADDGRAAGSWVVDGNTSEETARALLNGIEDGDPMVVDSLPSNPLSGEWADGVTEEYVAEQAGVPEETFRAYERATGLEQEENDAAVALVEEVLGAYLDAWSTAVSEEVERATRAMLEPDADEVLSGYVTCALWSSTTDDGEPMDDDHGADDVDAESLAAMRADVVAFLSTDAARAHGWRMEPEQVGHDLWLTRNGHGAGFWDRGLGDAGEELSNAARAMGESTLYVGDDGHVHLA